MEFSDASLNFPNSTCDIQWNSTPRLGWLMIRLAGAVEFEQLPVFRRHRGQSGIGCEFHRLFRCGHRFRETPGLRVSGGQSPYEQRVAIMSQLTGPFGQTNCFGSIAQLIIRTGGQRPRQVVQRQSQIGI